jgi:hypothetical protein
MKDLDSYGAAFLRSAVERGHSIGLHPYSVDGSEEGFDVNFRSLARKHADFIGGPISAVRNHRFQRTTRLQTALLEREWNIGFDFNCVAVFDRCWLGSASSVALPTPLLPQLPAFPRLPLHLPTVVEDDVFLFSHDYCYRAYADGDSGPSDTVARFLDKWILQLSYPAVVNYHPEHVVPDLRHLFDSLCEWVRSRSVWAPSIDEYSRWLKARAQARIDVQSTGTVSINAPVEIVVRSAGNAGEERFARSVPAGVTELNSGSR